MWDKIEKFLDKHSNIRFTLSILWMVSIISGFGLMMYYNIPWFLIFFYGGLVVCGYYIILYLVLLFIKPVKTAKEIFRNRHSIYEFIPAFIVSGSVVCCYHTVNQKTYYYYDSKKVYHKASTCQNIKGEFEEEKDFGLSFHKYKWNEKGMYYQTDYYKLCALCFSVKELQKAQEQQYYFDTLRYNNLQEEIVNKREEIKMLVEELDSLKNESYSLYKKKIDYEIEVLTR